MDTPRYSYQSTSCLTTTYSPDNIRAWTMISAEKII